MHTHKEKHINLELLSNNTLSNNQPLLANNDQCNIANLYLANTNKH